MGITISRLSLSFLALTCLGFARPAYDLANLPDCRDTQPTPPVGENLGSIIVAPPKRGVTFAVSASWETLFTFNFVSPCHRALSAGFLANGANRRSNSSSI